MSNVVINVIPKPIRVGTASAGERSRPYRFISLIKAIEVHNFGLNTGLIGVKDLLVGGELEKMYIIMHCIYTYIYIIYI